MGVAYFAKEYDRVGLREIVRPAAFFVAFLIPAALTYNYLLNHFYDHGGWTWDTGWQADIVGRPSFFLPMGPLLDELHYGNFYAVHFSPILTLASWIGALTPFGGPRILALLFGGFQGVLGLTVYAALDRVCRSSALVLRALALPVAIFACFSGAALATISSPHFELGMPPFLLAFVTFRAMGHRRLTIAAFVLCLMIREDAGLHLTLLIGLIAATKAGRTRSFEPFRRELPYVATAIAYAVVGILIQKLVFHGGHLFEIEYMGSPPFAHLTRGRVSEVLSFFLHNRGYVWYPLAVTVAAAILARSWVLPTAFVSSVPWLAINLAANFMQIAKFVGYYAFPFIVGSCWPATAALLERPTRSRLRAGHVILIQLAVTVSSIIGFIGSGGLQDDAPWRSFLPVSRAVSISKTDALVQWIGESKPQLGRIVAGDGVIALAPDLFQLPEFYKWNDAWSPTRFAGVDTLVFFRTERLAADLGDFVAANPDAQIFQGRKTHIVIATRRAGPDLALRDDLLTRPCIDLPARVLPARTNSQDDAIQLGGWSGPEEKGRWTDGPEAFLSFQLCHVPSAGVTLNVEAAAFVTDRHPAQEVDVLANGTPVAHWHFDQGTRGTSPIAIPAEALKGRQTLRITFRIADPTSPAAVGLSADSRALGIYLSRVNLDPAPVR